MTQQVGGSQKLELGLQQMLQQAPSSPSRSFLPLCTSATATLCLFISSRFCFFLTSCSEIILDLQEITTVVEFHAPFTNFTNHLLKIIKL